MLSCSRAISLCRWEYQKIGSLNLRFALRCGCLPNFLHSLHSHSLHLHLHSLHHSTNCLSTNIWSIYLSRIPFMILFSYTTLLNTHRTSGILELSFRYKLYFILVIEDFILAINKGITIELQCNYGSVWVPGAFPGSIDGAQPASRVVVKNELFPLLLAFSYFICCFSHLYVFLHLFQASLQ